MRLGHARGVDLDVVAVGALEDVLGLVDLGQQGVALLDAPVVAQTDLDVVALTGDGADVAQVSDGLPGLGVEARQQGGRHQELEPQGILEWGEGDGGLGGYGHCMVQSLGTNRQ